MVRFVRGIRSVAHYDSFGWTISSSDGLAAVNTYRFCDLELLGVRRFRDCEYSLNVLACRGG